ncbi:hypothetical protein CH274_28100 [Rhodococcus sp. 06-418-5]|nr:hypothetical protein CH274_28100 [Rhodococcus sp. 06-418-5]
MHPPDRRRPPFESFGSERGVVTAATTSRITFCPYACGVLRACRISAFVKAAPVDSAAVLRPHTFDRHPPNTDQDRLTGA